MFLNLLTVLFVGLKLANIINWSWWLIILPTIINILLPIILIIVVSIHSCTPTIKYKGRQ